MTVPAATPATTDSSTLYFGPWYRRSPFFEKTLEAGCSAYDIYNHMYLPGYYADPIEEYWALLNDVTVWDVSVERIVEITGPGRVGVHQHADLPRPDEMRRRPGQVRAHHGRGRRHRQRPGPAPDRGEPLVAGAGRLGCRAVGARRRDPRRDGRQGPRARGLSRSRSRAPSRRTSCGRCSARPSIDIKYYWTLTTEVDGIPVVISRTGWTGEVGYEIYLRDPSRGGDLWDRIMEAGKPHDIRPIAPCEARRIEAGIFNYGSDMTIDNKPFQVMGLERLVEPQDADYIGKAALEEIRVDGRRPQAGRHRGRRRRAPVRAVAQVRRAVGRQAGRHRDRPDLVAAAREEHRLRLGPDRPGRSRQRARDRRARRRRLAGPDGRDPVPRPEEDRPARLIRSQETTRDHRPRSRPRRSPPFASRTGPRRCCPAAPITTRRSTSSSASEWFRRDWIVVGREEDAATPGTYFLAEVDDEPLIVVRGA